MRYTNILKFAAALLILFNLGVGGYLLHLESLDKKETSRIEQNVNAMRSTTVMLANLNKVDHCVTAWALELALPPSTSIELPEKWQAEEIAHQERNIGPGPENAKYIEEIRESWRIFLAKNKKMFTQHSNHPTTEDARVSLVNEYNKSHDDYTRVKYALTESAKFHEIANYLMGKAASNKAANIAQSQNILLVAFIVNVASLLLLAVLPLVFPRVMASFRDNTSLFQKFCIIVAVPLLSQLSIYAVLAGFTNHVTKQLQQIATFYQLEELCRKTNGEMARLLIDGDNEGSRTKRVIEKFYEQKRTNQPHNQYLNLCYDQIIALLPETLALRPKLSADELWTDDRNPFGDTKFREYCDRLLKLGQVVSPSMMQEGLIRYRKDALEEQLAKIQFIINLSLLACLAQLGLGLLTLRLFSKAVTQRFALVAANMERYSRSEPLGQTLEGQDEAAALESFLRRTANTIEELSRREKQMIESASDVIFSVSDELNIKTINDAAAAQWGYQSGELLETPVLGVVSEDDQPALLSWLRTLKEGASGSQSLQLKHRDDRLLDCLIAAQWSPDSNQYFCVSQDITAQKQVDRLKRDFLAMVSHDLRTPLTASNLFLELLGAGVFGDLSEKGATRLQHTMHKSSELIALIKDLLDIERLESDKVATDRSIVELSDLKPEILSLISDALKAKEMSSEMSCPEDVFVKVNEDRLLQALLNLLLVVINKAERGSRLLIAISHMQGFAEIAVEWTNEVDGDPLEEEDFELYKGGERDGIASGASSKLALALVRSIIRSHQGEIIIRDGMQHRTICTLRIPLLEEYMTQKETSL